MLNIYYGFPIYNSKLHDICSTSNLVHPPFKKSILKIITLAYYCFGFYTWFYACFFCLAYFEETILSSPRYLQFHEGLKLFPRKNLFIGIIVYWNWKTHTQTFELIYRNLSVLKSDRIKNQSTQTHAQQF